MLNRFKGFIYDLVGWYVNLIVQKKSTNKLLIIKTDEIGDYILWRNFLKEIVSSDRFSHYTIHFCGNQSWKGIFEQFDAQPSIKKVFWLDKIKFKQKLLYRYQFLKQISKEGYAVIINPIYSRDKRNDDSIVKVAKAATRIGMEANQESIHPYEKGYDQDLYTEVFILKDKPVFEFNRNKLFTEFIIGAPSKIIDTRIDIQVIPKISAQIPENYFIVFPGSRSPSRIWPIENFIQVSNYLFDQYNYTVLVCGAQSDATYTNAFCNKYTHPFIDLTGKTSLTEMLYLLSKAKCLLSVDTGSVHLAAAVGCTVFGIFNGSQYKRFAPYPKDLASNFYAVYPDTIETELKNFESVKNKYEYVINEPYRNVSADKIVRLLQEIIV